MISFNGRILFIETVKVDLLGIWYGLAAITSLDLVEAVAVRHYPSLNGWRRRRRSICSRGARSSGFSGGSGGDDGDWIINTQSIAVWPNWDAIPCTHCEPSAVFSNSWIHGIELVDIKKVLGHYVFARVIRHNLMVSCTVRWGSCRERGRRLNILIRRYRSHWSVSQRISLILRR